MKKHGELSKSELFHEIRHQRLLWAGNRKLKIYGTLHCKSGKRMKVENRVFFASEKEAMEAGYRPCGHCMRTKYAEWKQYQDF
ncbi:Ada metal-binding domain-containing protein [Flagellimonas algicola]|uniref:Metal-binding protein n=1 Tax=Flagellimonas algicola TaxID=2583815 RepID=A0ABY2WIU1_9FLAO|nr:Ada metal-binding domain-containing protein [Allomuricauda algicola]TMU54749.1 metal-binding protein [Allomuricauda algicola]